MFPTGTRRIPPKPFAVSVVKDWYNFYLKTKNKDIYNRLNGCFGALQSNDLRAANYWLTQLEKTIIVQHEQDQEKNIRPKQTENLVNNLCQYSTTTRFDALNRREEELFSGISKNQRTLKRIFVNLTLQI